MLAWYDLRITKTTLLTSTTTPLVEALSGHVNVRNDGGYNLTLARSNAATVRVGRRGGKGDRNKRNDEGEGESHHSDEELSCKLDSKLE